MSNNAKKPSGKAGAESASSSGNTFKYVLWGLVAVALVAVGFLMFRPSGGAGVQQVDDAKMQELAADGVRLIDVRTVGEFEAGHIPGAENVPVDQVLAASASWDKSQPLAVYCATGSRSASAVQELAQAGFQTLYNFTDGMIAWTGEVDKGTAVAAAPAETLESPVLYEFYTDW